MQNSHNLTAPHLCSQHLSNLAPSESILSILTSCGVAVILDPCIAFHTSEPPFEMLWTKQSWQEKAYDSPQSTTPLNTAAVVWGRFLHHISEAFMMKLLVTDINIMISYTRYRILWRGKCGLIGDKSLYIRYLLHNMIEKSIPDTSRRCPRNRGPARRRRSPSRRREWRARRGLSCRMKTLIQFDNILHKFCESY